MWSRHTDVKIVAGSHGKTFFMLITITATCFDTCKGDIIRLTSYIVTFNYFVILMMAPLHGPKHVAATFTHNKNEKFDMIMVARRKNRNRNSPKASTLSSLARYPVHGTKNLYLHITAVPTKFFRGLHFSHRHIRLSSTLPLVVELRDKDWMTHCHTSIHSVFCLTTGPKPPPKRFLHIVRSRASSFKWEYPILSLRSSSSSYVFFLVFLSLPSLPLSFLR